MTNDLTDAELDEALAVLSGRKPRAMTSEDAWFELAAAEKARRAPDARAVETRERVRVAQDAVKDVAPWRAAAPWEQYDELIASEARLADLISTRRGVTVDVANEMATQRLREAWAKGGGSRRERFDSAVKVLTENVRDLAATTPIVPAPGPGPVDLTDAELDEALANLSGRTVKGA